MQSGIQTCHTKARINHTEFCKNKSMAYTILWIIINMYMTVRNAPFPSVITTPTSLLRSSIWQLMFSMAMSIDGAIRENTKPIRLARRATSMSTACQLERCHTHIDVQCRFHHSVIQARQAALWVYISLKMYLYEILAHCTKGFSHDHFQVHAIEYCLLNSLSNVE